MSARLFLVCAGCRKDVREALWAHHKQQIAYARQLFDLISFFDFTFLPSYFRLYSLYRKLPFNIYQNHKQYSALLKKF